MGVDFKVVKERWLRRGKSPEDDWAVLACLQQAVDGHSHGKTRQLSCKERTEEKMGRENEIVVTSWMLGVYIHETARPRVHR